MTKAELKDKGKTELLALAKEMDAGATRDNNKDEIVSKILNAQRNAARREKAAQERKAKDRIPPGVEPKKAGSITVENKAKTKARMKAAKVKADLIIETVSTMLDAVPEPIPAPEARPIKEGFRPRKDEMYLAVHKNGTESVVSFESLDPIVGFTHIVANGCRTESKWCPASLDEFTFIPLTREEEIRRLA